MTTLLLAPDPATGSHRLTITPTAEVTRIRRTDANGTEDVRTLPGVLPHPVGSVLVLDDYEPAHGPSSYTLTTAAGTVTGTIVLVLGSPWLSTPELPQFSAAVAAVLDYGSGAQTRSVIHEPDGDAPPLVITRGGATRRGSLTVTGGTYPEVLTLFRFCQRGQTMLLRQTQHAGMDMFFIPTAFDIRTAAKAGARSLFDLDLQYIEVARPAGPLAGALGWTWAGLAAAYATWGDVSDAYATWGDLRIDRRKS